MNKALLKYIISLIIFGSNGILASMIKISGCQIVMFRTLMGSILLISICIATIRDLSFARNKRALAYLCLSGISMGISWVFLYEAYDYLGVSLATLGYYCGPIFVIALSPFLFGEKLNTRKIICFFVVFAGIILINGGIYGKISSLTGIKCALMAAILYACMVSFSRKAEAIEGLVNPTIQLTLAFVSVFVYVMAKQGLKLNLHGSDILPLAILGLFNTGIGCLLYFTSLEKLEVQTVAILGYLEPLSAVFFSFVFLNENLSLIQLTGALLIISGAALSGINTTHYPGYHILGVYRSIRRRLS